MNTADLLALLPFLLIAGTSVFVMLAIAMWRQALVKPVRLRSLE